MTDDIAGDDEGGSVPEPLLNWIAAGRPEAVPSEVERWREGRADAEAEIAAIARVWDAAETPAPPAGGLDDLRARLAAPDIVPRARTRMGTRARWPLQAAAAVLLVTVGAVAGSRLLGDLGGADVITRIDVPPGASVAVELPGEIAVQLNAGSSLSYRTSADEVQEVMLAGEGFFSVHHDPDRTFTVRTESGVIRDVGTEFGVRARDGSVSVIVTEGVVALEAEGQAVQVAAGYTSSAIRGQAPTPAAPAEPGVALAWTEGRMVFIDQTLGSIASDLSRRFGVVITVAPSLVEQRVTASVGSPADLDNALRLITLAADARYERAATGWRITAR